MVMGIIRQMGIEEKVMHWPIKVKNQNPLDMLIMILLL